MTESTSQLSHITSMEIDHEVIFMVILLLIQEDHLSVTGNNMCTSTG